MPGPTDIDVAFDRVAAMLRTATARIGSDEREIRARARTLVAEYNALAGTRRVAARKVAKFQFLRPIPLLGTAVLSPLQFDLGEASSAAAAARARAERQLRRLGESAEARRGLAALATRAEEARSACRPLGLPPPFVQRAFEGLGTRIASLMRRSDTRGIDDVRQAASDLVAFSERWVEAVRRIEAEAVRPPPAISAGRRPTTMASDRIWLPIPWNRRSEAVALGAVADLSARHGSDVFVPAGRDLRPFERMLPLAFRARRGAPFEFPPIAAKAAGQNLWSLFDEATWNHVRKTNYARSGHRCMLCGEQRPRIVGAGAAARGPVDAHEVWSWSMPDDDPSLGVGIQRLERIMVLCPTCHACFHAGHAVSAARRDARHEEAAAFIRARQSDITGLEGDALDAHLARSAGEWDRTRGVERWILDLSHLASQDYMADADPVFLAENAAGFAPEHVAGLSFAADDGRRFERREAAAIQARLLEDAPRLRLAWSRA
ncbi:hypothetical protein [Methylorubrum extorquens]|nr:hypothetical protein [Methylorubrum extorquens]MCP1545514.1 hypothetical protein [Methylorubrum extorquens]MCP1591465.1 hypothetical protein [Methylorubrum extorquens]